MTKNKRIIVYIWLVVLLSPLRYALAGSATVTWNANTESDLASYKIYYGTSARIGTDPKTCQLCGYTLTQSVAKTSTSYTFSNLTDGATYYFSVTAIDTSNNESAFSAQVSKAIPVLGNRSADLNADGRVNAQDLSILVSYWGATNDPIANLDRTSPVGLADLSIMMTQWSQ